MKRRCRDCGELSLAEERESRGSQKCIRRYESCRNTWCQEEVRPSAMMEGRQKSSLGHFSLHSSQFYIKKLCCLPLLAHFSSFQIISNNFSLLLTLWTMICPGRDFLNCWKCLGFGFVFLLTSSLHMLYVYLHCFDCSLQIPPSRKPWLVDYVHCLRTIGQTTGDNLSGTYYKHRQAEWHKQWKSQYCWTTSALLEHCVSNKIRDPGTNCSVTLKRS